MDTLYIVMPAYNEEENIETVIKQWYPKLLLGSGDSRLVVADNGSMDSTHDILIKLQGEFDRLIILDDTEKYHGPKVMALYRYAVDNGADFVFQTDSDGQTDPAEFDEFWNERDSHEALIGNRIVRGDGKSRAFIEKVVCLLLWVIFKVKIPDANAPFRLMRSESLDKYLKRLPDTYDIPNIMISTYYVYYKEDCVFIPISFAPRAGGKGSVNLARIIKTGLKALKDFYGFRKEMKTTANAGREM